MVINDLTMPPSVIMNAQFRRFIEKITNSLYYLYQIDLLSVKKKDLNPSNALMVKME